MHEDDWLSVTDAAKISGYHPEHLRRLIRKQRIEARKFAIVWRVNKKSLLSYLEYAEMLGEKRGPKEGIDK